MHQPAKASVHTRAPRRRTREVRAKKTTRYPRASREPLSPEKHPEWLQYHSVLNKLTEREIAIRFCPFPF